MLFHLKPQTCSSHGSAVTLVGFGFEIGGGHSKKLRNQEMNRIILKFLVYIDLNSTLMNSVMLW